MGDSKGRTWTEILSFNEQSALGIDFYPLLFSTAVPPSLVRGRKALHQDEIFRSDTVIGPESLLLWEPKHH